MLADDPSTIWVVGGGNMGGAMMRGWIAAGLPAHRFTVIDPALPTMPEGVQVAATLPPDAAAPAILLLAVKPQLLDALAPQLAPIVSRKTLLVSIMAGIELGSLISRFPRSRSIVRIMPNLAVSIGRGVSAICTVPSASPALFDEIDQLMRPLGLVEWIDDERQFDAVTAVCGCAPAFLFRFIDALASGGAALGLSSAQSARMALATVDGAARLASVATDNPTTLANRVASPGGATRAGLEVLDQDNQLGKMIGNTLAASAQRNSELAQPRHQ